MQSSGIRTMQPNWAAPQQGPWLARFFGKLVLDILPAALASVIGGFLFTQYHFVHTAQPQLVDVQPASPEMMAMVRDEHALIINYLKAQMAAEQRRDQAEDAATARAAEEARAAADAKLADALFASQTQIASSPAKRSGRGIGSPESRVGAPQSACRRSPPRRMLRLLLRKQIRLRTPATAAPSEARDPDSLLANPLVAKTLDIKDHVVAATRHVVSVIGGMFASVGDSIGGAVSGNRQFNSAS